MNIQTEQQIQHVNAVAKYCNEKFAGWTIGNFGMTEDGYVAFTLRKGSAEKVAFLLSDPEGNDVGFLEEAE